jgi:peptidoglycan hydrolase-like protein with peptidoglycan-binding domain
VLPSWYRRPIRPGDTGPDVVALKRIFGLDWETPWDDASVMLLRGYYGTDTVTPEIAAAIGEAAAPAAGLPPLWFERDLHMGDYGNDVDAVRRILGLRPGVYDETLRDAVKRYEGNHGINPTGVVTEKLALIMGEA